MAAALILGVFTAGRMGADPAPAPGSGATPGKPVQAVMETAPAEFASTEGSAPAKQPSIYDRIWSYTTWHNDADNPVIQRFQFVGRFQLDYVRVEADQGNLDQWNIRRLRLGGRASLFHDFTAHCEVDLNPQEGPTYLQLTDAYAGWNPSQQLDLKLGKQGMLFTMDGQTSSRRLLTLERNNVANNLWFTRAYSPGASVAGEPGLWVYHVGAYSAGKADSEFGNTFGGVVGIATMGYNFASALDVKEALLRLNYVYNAPENANAGTLFANRPFEQIGSLNFSFAKSGWGVRTDLSGGLGYGDASDVWGAMVMPWINLSEHLQVATRYTFLRSMDPRSVRLNRYENQITLAQGDEYHEFYLGLNWYLYSHNLKLQTGVTYAYLEDRVSGGAAYEGWGWTTGLRISW